MRMFSNEEAGRNKRIFSPEIRRKVGGFMGNRTNRYRRARGRTALTVAVTAVVVCALSFGAYTLAPRLLGHFQNVVDAGNQPDSAPSAPPASSMPGPSAPAASAPALSAPAVSAPVPPASNPAPSGGAMPAWIDPASLSGYAASHPSLYAKGPVGDFVEAPKGTVYLTFDDGPSALTAPLLQVLDQYGAKATFFLCDQSGMDGYMPEIRKIYEQGSTCAVHSYSHEYKKIYASVDAFLDDFQKMYDKINAETDGHCARVFRFPGGSNATPNEKIREDLLTEMLRRGFVYYDWDGDSRDASDAANSSAAIYQNVVSAIQNGSQVILLHNTGAKQATLDAMPKILQWGKENGYTFAAMPENLDPFYYSFTNKLMIPAMQKTPYFTPSEAMQKKYPQYF